MIYSIHTKLILCLLASVLIPMSVQASPAKTKENQVAIKAPSDIRLVIGIAIEDFQPEYLQMLSNNLRENGFRRFTEKGVVISNVDYGTPLDFTSSLAMLHTGTTPAVNGVPSAKIYNRETMRTSDIFTDTSVMGNFTNETLSPASITVSTVTDEIRIAGDGVTYAFSVAPTPAPAIIQGGHTAGAAIWLNKSTGNWASSTYYTDMPSIVTQRNRLSPLATRIDTMKWIPMHEGIRYPGLPDHLTHYPFRYIFQRNDSERFDKFMKSPLMNTEVTNLAIDCIKTLSLGRHEGGTDVLNIAYTLSPYNYTKKTDNRFELMDAYYRLDSDIERIISTAEQLIGRDNILIWIVATPMSQTSRRDDTKWRIPYGEFSPNKAIALLNMYLMAIHGNGEWVRGFSGNDFYLNTKLITDHGKDILTIRSQSAEFLRRMAGVSEVYTIDDIALGKAGENGEALRRNTSVKHAGDMRIVLLPGWMLLDDTPTGRATKSDTGIHREVSPTAPVMLWKSGINPSTINTPVDARSIAPTITSILKVRTPNAASKPLIDIK